MQLNERGMGRAGSERTASDQSAGILTFFAIAGGAHLLNWLVIPLGYGLDLLPGMVLVYLAVLLFRPLPVVFLTIFALTPTYWHWGIPWAGLVITLEVAFVLLVKRRIRQLPLPIVVSLFWVSAGGLLWLAIGEFQANLAPLSVALIVVKQFLNDVLASSLSTLLLLLAVSNPGVIPATSRRLVYSARHILMNGPIVAVLVPALIGAVIIGKHTREDLHVEIESDVWHGIEMLQHSFSVMLASKTKELNDAWERHGIHGFEDTRSLLALGDSSVDLFEVDGRLPLSECTKPTERNGRHAELYGSQSTATIIDLICRNATDRDAGAIYFHDPEIDDGRVLTWIVRQNGPGSIALFSASKISTFFEISQSAPWKPNSEIRIYDTSDHLIGSVGDGVEIERDLTPFLQSNPRTDGNHLLHLWGAEGRGVSQMSVWKASLFLTQADLMPVQGLRAVSMMRPGPSIKAYREAMFSGLIVFAFFSLGLIVFLIILSKLISRILEPQFDNLLRLNALDPVARMRSRIIEVDALNRQVVNASSSLRASVKSTRESEKRLRGMILKSPAVLWQGLPDPEMGINFDYVTPSIQSLARVDRVTHRNAILDAVHVDDRKAFLDFNRQLTLRGFASMQYRLVVADRPVVWVYEEARGLGADGASDPVFSGMVLDISELKLTQAQLAKQSRMATLGDMASGIAHELNQPLQVIQLASDNAMDAISSGLDANNSDYVIRRLSRIHDQSVRAADIINHMRSFARSGQGEKNLIGLYDIVMDVLKLVGEKIRSSGLDVKVAEPVHDLFVRANRGDLGQMLVNVLLNSRDAMLALNRTEAVSDETATQRQVLIDVVPSQSGDRACLVVQDHAGGVSEEKLSRIVEPFFTTKDPVRNSGTGLSVAHWTVTENGGTLDIQNVGKGLRVCACFPRADPPREGGEPRALPNANKSSSRRSHD